MKTSKSLLLPCIGLALAALGWTLSVSAADSGSTVNPTGTWKWTYETQSGQTLEPSAKLTQAGDKLTGVLMINEQERPISEGTIKGGEVSFKVVSKRDDRTVTSHYRGKLSGDSIKGKWD